MHCSITIPSKDTPSGDINDLLICFLCKEILKDPKQCSICSKLFCLECLIEWQLEFSKCPNNCPNLIFSQPSPELINLLCDLELVKIGKEKQIFNDSLTVTPIHKSIRYDNGDSYEGEWLNGLREGYGLYKYADGKRYEGYYKNHQRNGIGRMTFVSGDFYEGEWVNDLFEGFGICQWSNGQIYEGWFMSNLRNGVGTMKYTDGNVYDGYWVDGIEKGYCVYHYTNGKRYEGEWKDNKKNGPGKVIYPNGGIIDGIWENDMLSFSNQ